MIVEYIRYGIDTRRADAFDQAYRQASEALEASEYCHLYEVRVAPRIRLSAWYGSSGTPKRDTCPASAEAQSSAASSMPLGPFVNDIEEMRHYEVTLSSASSS